MLTAQCQLLLFILKFACTFSFKINIDCLLCKDYSGTWGQTVDNV